MGRTNKSASATPAGAHQLMVKRKSPGGIHGPTAMAKAADVNSPMAAATKDCAQGVRVRVAAQNAATANGRKTSTSQGVFAVWSRTMPKEFTVASLAPSDAEKSRPVTT